jgi:hypothetical protein
MAGSSLFGGVHLDGPMADAAGAGVVTTGLVAVGLAAVHLFAGKLRVHAIPRRVWLSAAGGVSVAYVFVHLLPQVAARQATIVGRARASDIVAVTGRERLLFIAVLAGFALYFGLERLAHRSSRSPAREAVASGGQTPTSAAVFWLHVGSFALYNGVVGYLLVHREETGPAALSLFATAMALHFLVNDAGLAQHHETAYEHVGRWLLAAAVIVGFLVGVLTQLSHLSLSLLIAFLAGGIVLNVVKEELPPEREGRLWAFAAGIVGYTVVLLLV